MGGAWDWLSSLVVRIANLGVEGPEGQETRRIRAVNLSALAGFVLTSAWTIGFLLIDFSAMAPMIVPNLISCIGYLTTLFLSSRRQATFAMWTLILSMFLNLVTVGMFFGYDGGGWLYLILLPVLGALYVRTDDRWASVVVVVGGSIAFALVASTTGTGPQELVGTSLQAVLLFIVAMSVAVVASGLSLYYRHLATSAEARSDWLLSNILPSEVAERLKAGESPIADRVSPVTILFADVVGSTPMAERMSPSDLVMLLNDLFSRFDDIAEEHGLEKIKTGGDSYVAVAGLPSPRPDHARAVADAALQMRDELPSHTVDGFGTLQMRFGIHTGAVVAGVIGKRKFSYDLYGDAVNTASRMESTGLPGTIQISEQVRDLLGDEYEFEARGVLAVKGKGDLPTYLLVGPTSTTSSLE